MKFLNIILYASAINNCVSIAVSIASAYDRDTQGQRYIQTEIHTDRETERQRDTKMSRHRDIQTLEYTNKKKPTHDDTQTLRERQREREKGKQKKGKRALFWQNKSAQSTAVDVDTGTPLRASTSGPPTSHTPCTYVWVELTREQSKIAPYLFETTVVHPPS